MRTLSLPRPATVSLPRPATRLATGLSAGVLALALTACGGDDSSAGSAAAPASSAGSSAGSSAASSAPSSAAVSTAAPSSAAPSDAQGSTVTAEEGDFTITLSSSTLTAGTYTFTVENTGSATHSLTIEGPGGVDVTSDTLQGGDSTTMTVELQPGEYEVYCPIGNHREMGMDTTLTVT